MAKDERDMETAERLAKLEAVVERLEEIVEEEREERKATQTKLDAVLLKLERYEGKIGGVLVVFVAIGTFLKLFWDDFRRFMGGD